MTGYIYLSGHEEIFHRIRAVHDYCDRLLFVQGSDSQLGVAES